MQAKHILTHGTLNTVLRGITLVSKLLLMVTLARYLDPSDVGRYGILAASISFSMYILGLDFHNFAGREIVLADYASKAPLIRDQFIFYTVNYLILYTALLCIDFLNIIETDLFYWFLLLLAVEHISHELYRILVFLRLPIRANLLMFLRSGIWCYIVFAIFYLNNSARDLQIVFIIWSTGGAVSILYGGSLILHRFGVNALFSKPVGWVWIIKGVPVGLLLLASSLAFRAVFTADRYLVQVAGNDALVGVYAFYANLANAILTLVDSAVVAILAPELIKSTQEELPSYLANVKRFFWSIILVSVLLFVLTSALIYPVVSMVGKEIYLEHIRIYLVVGGAVCLFSMSQAPHQILYAAKRDRAIALSSSVTSAVTIALCAILAHWNALYGVALGVMLGGLLTLVVKGVLAWNLVRSHSPQNTYSK